MVQKDKLNIYIKLKKFFTKQGKSQQANKLINKALISVSKNNKITLTYMLLYVFNKLNSFFEIRKLNLRRRTNFIPFAANKKRRVYLVIKRIKDILVLDKRKKSLSEKLKTEIVNIFLREKISNSLKQKKMELMKVSSYRSNIHFRW
jgi:ribosomal protein S7